MSTAVPPAIPPQSALRGLTAVVWTMMLIAFPIGLYSIFSALSPHNASPRGKVTPETARHLAFLGCQAAAILLVLAAGLRRRRFWAWDGTVIVAYLSSQLGILLAFGVLGLTTPRPSAIVASVILGSLLLVPGILLLRYLAQPAVRSVFAPPSPDRPVPDIWIRLIAASCLLESCLNVSQLLSPSPPAVFGLHFNAPVWILYIAAVTGLTLAVGLNLYRMREWARTLVIVYAPLAALQCTVWAATAPDPSGRFSYMRGWAVFTTWATSLAVDWYLVSRRRLFQRTA